MAQRVMPTLQIRHVGGDAWWVAASWPDGSVEDIAGFKSEFDANEWIANDFPTHKRKIRRLGARAL